MSRNRLLSWVLGAAGLLTWASPILAAELKAGPLVGDTTETDSIIWIQTDSPAPFQIRYWPVDQPDQVQSSLVGQTRQLDFMSGRVKLTGLKPGTRYVYELLLEGELTPRPYALGFSTIPAYRPGSVEIPDFKILVGSCFYLDDPLLKMLNISYGTGMQIFEQMVKTGGDMMFWLGDNVYLAPFDLSSRYNMTQRYNRHRRSPEVQSLFGGMPQLAIWDDHDFGPNNSNNQFPRRQDSLDLFKAYWPNARAGLLTTPGVFFTKKYVDLEFFATDNRYHRDPNDDPNPNKAFFGATQLAWLKNELKASKSTFKVVIVGSPVLNRHYVEALSQSKKEYNELMDFIKAEDIKGVVFLSGDRHHSLLMKMDRPGTYPLYEFTSSPLTSNPTQLLDPIELEDDWVVPDTYVFERNFGRLHVHGTQGARVLSLETWDSRGNLLWSHDIPEKELGY